MLGTDLIATLRERGATVVVSDRDTLDITDAAAVTEGIAGADVVVNCAAYTAVDAAEEHEASAYAVNAEGAGVIARACAASGITLVHLSTDYVFDGEARAPYVEDAPLGPRSAYGRTKAAGERAVLNSGARALIVRTAWLYGAHGSCFPKTIARLGHERGALDVVDDQIGQPTWTVDLADLLIRLVESDAPPGIYHGTSSGETSWFDFAREIVAAAGLGDIVSPCDTSAFPRPARRPAYAVLGHGALDAIGVAPIGDWKERWTVAAPSVLETLD
jgi:dTDP-4-dehydrorhamnose reductase